MFSSASVVKQVLSLAVNAKTEMEPGEKIESKFHSLKANFFKAFALYRFEVIFIIEESGS